MHGDAAFAGQGLVAETLDLSELSGYRTGGTIHFIVNNQIGFTTVPTYSRSGPYCTDVAKIVQAPILHVNGDDPEAVVHVSRIATEFRQQFKRDVVIDMFCYRRHGHNEADEPTFTQPLMYKEIGGHTTVTRSLRRTLEAEGVVTAADVDGDGRRACAQKLDKALEAATNYKPNKADWLEGKWAGFTVAPGEEDRKGATAVELDQLREVGRAICRARPRASTSTARSRASSRRSARRSRPARASTGRPARRWPSARCWSRARRCACRGQDSGRGTFTQRHAVLVDQTTESEIRAAQQHPRRTRRTSRSSTARCPRPACWASSTATRWPSPSAGAVGGAVRRLRQRRAGHHRPVHLLAARASGCACPAW